MLIYNVTCWRNQDRQLLFGTFLYVASVLQNAIEQFCSVPLATGVQLCSVCLSSKVALLTPKIECGVARFCTCFHGPPLVGGSATVGADFRCFSTVRSPVFLVCELRSHFRSEVRWLDTSSVSGQSAYCYMPTCPWHEQTKCVMSLRLAVGATQPDGESWDNFSTLR
jgi:hypothetical protein